MFKKTEESEWTRFSRALGGRDQSREREEPPPPEEEDLLEAAPTMASPPVPVEPPAPQAAAARPSAPADHVRLDLPAGLPPAEPPVPTAAPRSRSMAIDEAESIIGTGTTFEGTFRSEHSIRIRGSVQGEVESRQRVYVEPEARVNAKIIAEEIMVDGEVNGELACPGRVEITPSGRVTGEITAGRLIMQEGAYFEGHLKMTARGARAEDDSGLAEVSSGV